MADKNKTEPEMIPWDQVRHYINVLLDGTIGNKDDGRPAIKYLDNKPPKNQYDLDEKTARRALAQLLRSGLPLDQNLRDQLAALFDGTHQRTKVKFQRQTAGKPVAVFVDNRIQDGVPWEKALEEATNRFGYSLETTRKFWEGRRDNLPDTSVAVFIYELIENGMLREQALPAAAARFDLKFETVRTIWEGDRKKGSLNKGYRKLLEEIRGPLPPR